MASERLRRLFVAVLLPPEVEAELEALEKRLKRQVQAPLKWVRPEAIHLTLKFLGAFPDSRLADLKGALQAAAEGFQQAPFSLQLGPLGTFGTRGQVNVLWVGVEGALAPLAELARAIDKAAETCEVPPEKRAFKAHLTLARARRDRPVQFAVASLAAPKPVAFTVSSFALVESHLAPQGARYEVLAHYRLG